MKKTTFRKLAGFAVFAAVVDGLVWMRMTTTYQRRSSRLHSDFNSLGAALRMYEMNAGAYPTTTQGLEALITEPITGPPPKRWTKLMDERPLDPWQNPYRYERVRDPAATLPWKLISAGPDGLFGTDDDLSADDLQ